MSEREVPTSSNLCPYCGFHEWLLVFPKKCAQCGKQDPLGLALIEARSLRALVVELCEAFEALDKAYCDAWAWSAAEPLKAGREVLARARLAAKPHG